MSLFAIGDLHLSLNGDKPMDVVGGRWQDYTNKIKKGFSETEKPFGFYLKAAIPVISIPVINK